MQDAVTAFPAAPPRTAATSIPITCPSLILTKGVHVSGLVRDALVLFASAQERGGTLSLVPLRVVLSPLVLLTLGPLALVALRPVALNRVVGGFEAGSSMAKVSGSLSRVLALRAICSCEAD